MNPITTLSGVGPNPPVVVEAGSAGGSHVPPASGDGLRYPLSYYLGDYTCAALAGDAVLTLGRNRSGSFSAEVKWTNGNAIAGTMPTPSEALAQLESAISREIEG
jgi:hypothetical protein